MEVIYDALNKICKPYNRTFNKPNFKNYLVGIAFNIIDLLI